jgi:hypothetical protein
MGLAPRSHVVLPITAAGRRGRARASRPPARPFDWSETPDLQLATPELSLIVAALRDLRVEAADELADEISRHLTAGPRINHHD